MEGEGILIDYLQNTKYNGVFVDGNKHGVGTCNYKNGNRF